MLVFEVKIGAVRNTWKLSFLTLNVETCSSKIAMQPCLKQNSLHSEVSQTLQEFEFSFLINSAVLIICLCLTILSTPFPQSSYNKAQHYEVRLLTMLNTDYVKGWDKEISKGLAIPSPDHSQGTEQAGRQAHQQSAGKYQCLAHPFPCCLTQLSHFREEAEHKIHHHSLCSQLLQQPS